MNRDKRLSASARVVYAEIALWVFDGTSCWIGQRAIAERLGFTRNTVAKAIDELVALGHMEIVGTARGDRPCYVLSSRVFNRRIEAEMCDECGRRLPKFGAACVACVRDKAKLDAWQEAKRSLPDGASDVEIAARVAAEKVVKSHRRAARESDRIDLRDLEWKAS